MALGHEGKKGEVQHRRHSVKSGVVIFFYLFFKLKAIFIDVLAKNSLSCYRISTMLTKIKKTKVIKTVQKHDKDTGSPEVQIAVITKRIEELANHLKTHKKDFHSRRGLLQLVADRQKHMKYLRVKSPKRYEVLAKKLDLKK